MTLPERLRFFAAVSPPARVLVVVLAILAAAAGAIEAVHAGSSDWVLASIAIVQLFAASTGFRRYATRGYYDPILREGSRTGLALAHFAVSAGPGIGAWFATGVAQSVAARSFAVPAFRTSGCVTLLLVTAAPWAAGVRLSRFAVGVLWLLLTASVLVSGVLLAPLTAIHADPSWAARNPLRAIGVGLAFPMVIPSLSWPPAVLGAFGGVALFSLSAGVAQIARGEFPLSEEGA